MLKNALPRPGISWRPLTLLTKNQEPQHVIWWFILLSVDPRLENNFKQLKIFFTYLVKHPNCTWQLLERWLITQKPLQKQSLNWMYYSTGGFQLPLARCATMLLWDFPLPNLYHMFAWISNGCFSSKFGGNVLSVKKKRFMAHVLQKKGSS